MKYGYKLILCLGIAFLYYLIFVLPYPDVFTGWLNGAMFGVIIQGTITYYKARKNE